MHYPLPITLVRSFLLTLGGKYGGKHHEEAADKNCDRHSRCHQVKYVIVVHNFRNNFPLSCDQAGMKSYVDRHK